MRIIRDKIHSGNRRDNVLEFRDTLGEYYVLRPNGQYRHAPSKMASYDHKLHRKDILAHKYSLLSSLTYAHARATGNLQPGSVTMIARPRVATTVCSYCTTGAGGVL